MSKISGVSSVFFLRKNLRFPWCLFFKGMSRISRLSFFGMRKIFCVLLMSLLRNVKNLNFLDRQIFRGSLVSFLKSVRNLQVPDCPFLGMRKCLVFFLRISRISRSPNVIFQESEKSSEISNVFFSSVLKISGVPCVFFLLSQCLQIFFFKERERFSGFP